MEGCDDRPCGRDDHPTFDSRNERGGEGGGGGVMKNKKNAGWMKRGEMEEAGGGGGTKEGKGKKYGGRAIVIAAESFCRGIFQNDWAP